MRLAPGTMVSVYRIESVVGEGGMGVVYRAWDEAMGRTVALKCLHTNLAGDAAIRSRFAREARVLSQHRHDNVVRVYDFVEDGYLLAIVMELVEGPTLVRYLEKWRGRPPLPAVARLFSGVLEAVGAGHQQGIVHRDLKPDNVMVLGTGPEQRPKVVDFGIAKILEGTTYTMSHAFLGTCCYMAPEQVKQSSEADPLSDIYSLGITLYQLCTGRLPFEGNHFSVMMAHVNETPRPPRELRPDLPEALERLILDALAKNPEERPASCEEFLRRLSEILPEGAARPTAPLSLAPELEGGDGQRMVLIGAGSFQMGKNKRRVHLDDFYLDVTPVTNRQFLTFVQVTGYRPNDAHASRFLNHFSRGEIPKGKEEHPVVFVSWTDAWAYANWAGKRLPTEAEWEKAARGDSGRKFPWGRAEPGPATANYGNARGATTPVGAHPAGASPYGVLDLAGNVWEWCEDYYASAFYLDGPTDNPQNSEPGDGSRRVMRGGSYLYGTRALRTYSRNSFEPHYRFADGGFRCARSAR